MTDNLNSLRAFLVIAETGNFSKGASQLGITRSAVSRLIKNLETDLKTKLFNRTTRSISTTEAGEQLYQELAPLFREIDNKVHRLSTLRNSLSGKLRINGSENAYTTVLWKKLKTFCQKYPEVQLELMNDLKFLDVVEGRFDAGIRLGDLVEKDMIAVRISPDIKMCVVATPDYWAKYGTPERPQDLIDHRCLQICISATSHAMQWQFVEPNNTANTIKFNPKGQISLNSIVLLKRFLLEGLGVAWTSQESVAEEIAQGKLVTVLDDWAINYTGYHLYYPHKRADDPLFKALLDVLKE